MSVELVACVRPVTSGSNRLLRSHPARGVAAASSLEFGSKPLLLLDRVGTGEQRHGRLLESLQWVTQYPLEYEPSSIVDLDMQDIPLDKVESPACLHGNDKAISSMT